MVPFLIASSIYAPVWILLTGICVVILGITWLRLHPFFCLMLAAVIVGVISPSLPGDVGNAGWGAHWVNAVETPMRELGIMAGKIAFVIALASVIGVCLTESGAADKIVLRFVAVLGEGLAPLAMLLSGFVLSIPVFFDTVFFLLIPLARALARRVGKNYVYFVMAIGGGGVITHSLVPPTPGPLLMVESLGIDLGMAIWVGVLVGLLPAFGVLVVGKWMDRRYPVMLAHQTGDGTLPTLAEEGLPPFVLSILPVVLPVALVSAVSIMGAGQTVPLAGALPWWREALLFLGNKNTALTLGAVLSVLLVVRRPGFNRERLESLVGDAMQTAGVIILITAAGGAFGAMINHSGIDETIKSLAENSGGQYLLIAWGVSAVFKIAQGSGTVAMVTTSAIMAKVSGGVDLGYHPIYLYLAIGFGSMFGSWMNDSGFWVVGRMSGFSEKQTLRTWTVLLIFIAVSGLMVTWALSALLPGV